MRLITVGALPPKEDTGTDYRGLIEKYLAAEKISLAKAEALPPDSFKKAVPNWICRLGLQRHHAVLNDWGTSGFYVGSASNFYDLVHYWNLRATDTDLRFYDPAFSDCLDAIRDAFLTMLRARPKSPHAFDAHIALWSEVDISDGGQPVDTQLDITGFGNDILPYPLN